MHYLPVTLIITLFASLFVAYIFNPVFAVTFMKHEYDQEDNKAREWKNTKKILLWIFGFALIFYIAKVYFLANLLVAAILLVILYHYGIRHWIKAFQDRLWPWLMSVYEQQLRFFLTRAEAWTIVRLQRIQLIHQLYEH